jgi:cytochrome d ubiquinol oxidase subunit I
MTAAAFVVGVSFWSMLRKRNADDQAVYRLGLRTGAAVMLVAGIGVAVSGDFAGKVMTEVQPMKMAAAEALYDTEQPAGFSLFTVGTPDGKTEKFSIKVPHLLSFLATGSTNGKVEGINQLRAQYEKTYGTDPGAKYYSPGDYTPYIPLTYWTFRFMIGLGVLAAGLAIAILYVTRREKVPTGRYWRWVAISLPLMPLFANSFGWLFTEMGRQPWAVFGIMTTAQSVSPGVSTFEAGTSLVVLTLVYAVLAVVEVGLILKYAKAGAEKAPVVPDHTDTDPDRPLAFAY